MLLRIGVHILTIPFERENEKKTGEITEVSMTRAGSKTHTSPS